MTGEGTAEPRAPSAASSRSTIASASRRLAGPGLIAGSVVLVQHGFAFGDRFPSHYELLGEWLPNFCFLGRSVAALHIPAWNPHVMGGIPFAADPLHGWLNLPAMGLFSLLSCGTAFRTYLLILPILAGLGLHWFLRSEGVSRAAAVCGGLVLALGIAGSGYFALPWVAAPLAWTAVMLACASKYVRAPTLHLRLAWAALTALAWGEVAATNLSIGLLIATTALLVFVAPKLVSLVRAHERSIGEATWQAVLLVSAIPLVSIAVFLPRLAYLPETTLGIGYRQLDAISRGFFGGRPAGAVYGPPPPGAPLLLAFSPGLYAGATALGLVFGGLWSRRLRTLSISFAALGALFYVLMLPPVVRLVEAKTRPSVLVDSYLHAPDRFYPGLFLAVALLAALGVEAWREPRSPGRRALIILPAAVIWGALPPLFHWALAHLILFGVGAALATMAWSVSAFRPSVVWLIPIVLAAELVSNGLIGTRPAAGSWADSGRLPFGRPLVQDVTTLDLGAYLKRQPFEHIMLLRGGGRYVSLDAPDWGFLGLGYIRQQVPSAWELLTTQRSMLSGLEEAQGYNSAQLIRYWKFMRRVGTRRVQDYRSAFFAEPPDVALDLLQVRWIIGLAGSAPPVAGALPVARDGRWSLFWIPSPPPRASVVSSWTVVGTADQALNDIADPTFDPSIDVTLERASGLADHTGIPGGSASYQTIDDQSARVAVHTSAPAIVLVRNAYDPHWHAEVDGHPVNILPADDIDQGIPVPAGSHTILLRYEDPRIGWGLFASGIALTLLLVGAMVGSRRFKRGK